MRRQRSTLPGLAPALLAVFALALGACGGGGGGGGPAITCAGAGGPLLTVTGTVLFERLPLSPVTGLGGPLITRPARFVDVHLRAAGSATCYGATSTDANGAYVLVATPPAGAQVQVVVRASTAQDPLRHVTVHNALPPPSNSHSGADAFSHAGAAFAASGTPTVNLTVPYNPGNNVSRPSIGFGVLDVLLTCSEAIRTGTGETPPLCHAYTLLGNGGATGTSFYDSGSQALNLLGGAAGNLDNSDTDYFDDGVIAHEYGHFVEFLMAATRNRGGAHGGEALEPAFSWGEGAATGWGCLLRNDPKYIDTLRTSAFPPQFQGNAENWTPQLVRGIGGEETVTEIVWDLGDGIGAITDTDGDGVGVGLGPLYGEFLAFDGAQVVPYIGTLLDRVVANQGVPAASITALLLAPENQQISYPLAGADIWPVPLAVPGVANGAADSLSGSNKNQCRGLSSSVWYAFTLAAPATRTFTLTIGPTAGNGDNLNLYLETFPGGLLDDSENVGASSEIIGPILLAAGSYVVRVEADCAGAGNQATYTLTVN